MFSYVQQHNRSSDSDDLTTNTGDNSKISSGYERATYNQGIALSAEVKLA